jgi:hypothetical protein
VYNSIQLGQSKRLCRKEIGSRQESENNGKHLKTTFQNKTPTRLYRFQLLNRGNIMLWKELNKHAIASKTVTSTNNDLSFSLTQRQEPQMKWEEHIYIYHES